MNHDDDRAGIRLSELRHVVEELRGSVGRPVRDAWVPSPHVVLLAVGDATWRFEARPLARVHPSGRRPPGRSTPLSFQGVLRARFLGRLDRVGLVGDDRIVEIETSGHVLHARLFDRGGGLWLVGPDGRVVAAATGPAPPDLPPTPPPGTDLRLPRFEPTEHGWGDAARRFFDALADRRRDDALRGRLASHLRDLRRREARLVANLGGDLEATTRAADLRRRADALAAVLHEVPRGATTVAAPDPEESDQVWQIALEPGKPPSATLVRLYDKAARLERAVGPLVDRLDAAERRMAEIDGTLARLPHAEDLESVARRWRLPADRPAEPAPVAAAAWTWVGPEGSRVHVGRSDAGNHELVFRLARGRDVWVHVRGRPGAHVVVPWTRTDVWPPEHVLVAACSLATWSSRVPAGERVEVQVARVKDVRAVRGAGPGRVTVTNERVRLVVAPDGPPAAWQRES